MHSCRFARGKLDGLSLCALDNRHEPVKWQVMAAGLIASPVYREQSSPLVTAFIPGMPTGSTQHVHMYA